jgi:recombination protein RecA
VSAAPIDERKKIIQATLAAIKKDGGLEFHRLGDRVGKPVPHIPTGIWRLDHQLIGIGGIPKGRIIEVLGPEASGKTSIMLHLTASAQKLGSTVAFIDAEHALDMTYASQLGVKTDDLLIGQPDNGEQALQAAIDLASSKHIGLVVVDSVANLVPKAELEAEMSDMQVGLQARMMAKALRKITAIANQSGTIIAFTNQIRCLEENTRVLTSRGVLPISDVLVGDLILSPNRGLVPVLNTTEPRLVQGSTLIPRYRLPLTLSANHQQPVVSKDGDLVTKLGKDVMAGDWLIHPIVKQPVCTGGNSKLRDGVASYLGCYFSDGYIHQGEEGNFIALDEVSAERRAIVRQYTRQFFGNDYPYIKEFGKNTRVTRQESVDKLLAYGVGILGKNKVVPSVIMRGKWTDIVSFLRTASFDTHGFTDNGFIWTFESQAQAHEIAHILSTFGVIADIRERTYSYGPTCTRLYITAQDACLYRDLIGFEESKKQAKAALFTSHTNARGKYDVVPHALANRLFAKSKAIKGISAFSGYGAIKQALYKDVNVGRQIMLGYLQDCLAHDASFDLAVRTLQYNRFSEITEVAPKTFQAVDLEVDGELFVANGSVTHNSKIGVTFGSSETTPGGRALQFYASLRIDVRRLAQVKEGDVNAGNSTRIKLAKNKVSPPFREAKFDLMFGEGLDSVGSLTDCAIEQDVWKQKASNYMFAPTGEVIMGRKNLRDELASNLDLYKQTEMATLQALGHTEQYIKDVVLRQTKEQQ